MSSMTKYDKLLEGLEIPQRSIVETLDRTVFVAAGAGSGKTFTLTRRIVAALCPGSGKDGEPYLTDIEQALVITFTNKAAGEIKERVRGALRSAGFVDQALKVDNAWISTIHGMCARILHENALDLGLDPEFGVGEEQQVNALRELALNKALDELKGQSDIDALFAEYGAAAADSNGASVAKLVRELMTLAAGATNGFDSIAFAGTPVDPRAEIFQLSVAYERLSSYENSFEGASEKLEHDRALLQSYLLLAPNSQTLEAATSLLAGLKRPSKREWSVKYSCAEAKEAQADLTNVLAQVEAELRFGAAANLQAPLVKLARLATTHFDALKRAAGILDNDDLLRLCARAFEEHPEIAALYTNKFKLVMIDEFQDTNTQQVNMIKRLAGEDCCHLCTVGDAQQAIYGFRGADVRVFEERQREVGESSLVRMDTNFRSDEAILRFVKRCCKDTDIVPGFMDLNASDKRDNHFEGIKHPRVVVEFGRAAYGTKPTADERRSIEAIQIADRLASMMPEVQPRQMAVLMRSTKHSQCIIDALRSRGIESVIVGGSTFADAPEVKTIAALLHTLANPKDTQAGLFAVLESPMFDLDANDLVALGTRAQDKLASPAKRRINAGIQASAPLFEGIVESERLSLAREVLARAWQRVGSLPVADIVLGAVRESGWLARLEHAGAQGRATAANILRAIDHIRALSEAEGLGPVATCDAFDTWLAGAKESPATLSGEGANAVSIMTVHASKGLEFDVVAVVGCTGSERSRGLPKLLSHREGAELLVTLAPKESVKLPERETLSDPSRTSSAGAWRAFMEEEATLDQQREDGRLFYVALTRARECVILSLNTYEKKDGTLVPAMAQNIADTLGIAHMEPGESLVDFAGPAPAVVRCCVPGYDEAHRMQVNSNHTLDEPIQAYNTFLARNTTEQTFDVFEVQTTLAAPLGFWRPREGTFSYSSAHKALDESRGALGLDAILHLPNSKALSAEHLAYLNEYPHDSWHETQKSKHKAQATVPLDIEQESEPSPTDADRATKLGSAFHELARLMVETGKEPSEQHIDMVAKNYGVSMRDSERLKSALKRWAGSALRAEVQSYEHLRAEVPFFCAVESEFGRDLEGAIDLLATSGKCALLVDYKTGDHGKTYGEIRALHDMQARFYAYVLGLQGFEDIECAFVCVELEDDSGQPVVTRYTF